MASKWKETKLNNIATIVMGQSPKKETVNKIGEGIPLLNGPTEFGSHFPVPVQFTSNASRLSKTGDILFCVRGSTTGRMNWSDQEYAIGRGLAAFRHKSGEKCQPYLKGLIDQYLPDLLAVSTGSTFPSISGPQLRNLVVKIPSLVEQKAIAHILGSLDDKIELNRRMNETLEAIAQAMFKSWFVDFDPVIDNALAAGNKIPKELKAKAAVRKKLGKARKHLPKEIRSLFPSEFENSELGPIPQGWKVVDSSDLFDVKDGTHDSPKKANKGKFLITSRHITGDIIDFPKAYLISEEDFNQVNKRSKVNSFDILLTMIGTVGVPFLVMEKEINFAIKNVGLFKTGFDKQLSVFFFLYLKTKFMCDFLESRLAGTTQKYLTLKILRTLPVLSMPQMILDYFGKQALSVFEKIQINNEQNKSLSKLRDTLLPKLLSGEIRIKEAEKLVEELS